MTTVRPTDPQPAPRFEDFAPQVQRLARRLCRDWAEAEDVVQEVWLEALRSPVREPRALGAWLRIATIHAAQRNGKRDRRRRYREQVAARPEHVPSVIHDLERESVRRAVEAAVLDLEEPYREVVRLRFLEGLAPEEIAVRLDRRAGTVRSQVTRGLRKLERILIARGGGRRRRLFGLWPGLFVLPQGGRAPSLRSGALVAGPAAVAGVLAVTLALLPRERVHAGARLSLARGAAPDVAAVQEGLRGPDPAPLRVAVEPAASPAGPTSPEPGEPSRGSAGRTVGIRGRLRTMPPGERLGAQVWAQSEDGGEPRLLGEVETSGVVEVEAEVPCWVWCQGPGLAPSRRLWIEGGEEASDVRFTCQRQPLAVGQVREAGGAPVAGALVTLEARTTSELARLGEATEREPVPTSAVSDETGAFAIQLPSVGRLWAVVRAPGHAVHRFPTTPVDAPGLLEQLTLPAPAYLDGRLVESPGPLSRPLPGASLRVRTAHGDLLEASSAEGGSFRLGPLPPGPFRLVARTPDPGARSVLQDGVLAAGEERDLGALVPSDAWTLAGTLVSPEGDALAGWTVVARRDGEVLEGVTTSAGAFLLLGAAREEYDAWVRAPEEGAPSQAAGTLVRGADGRLVVARPSARVTGTWREAAAVPGLRFELRSDALEVPEPLEVDRRTGAVTSAAVPPGSYRLVAVEEGVGSWAVGELELSAGKDHALGAPPVLPTGSIVFRFGEGRCPAAAQWFKIDGPDVAFSFFGARSRGKVTLEPREGRCVLERLAPGAYRYSIALGGSAHQTGWFEIEAGRRTELDLELPAYACSLAVRVRSPRPLAPDEELEVLLVDGEEREPILSRAPLVKDDPETLWSFSIRLAPGLHRLEASTTGGLRGELLVDVPDGDPGKTVERIEVVCLR